MAAAMGITTNVPASMYDSVLMWPIVYFWKTCGIFLVDLSYNHFQLWFSVIVFASGVLNIAITPWSVCMLDGWCEDALSTTYRRLYTRMMACTSLMSRVAVVYKVRECLAEYKRREDEYEHNWPLSEPHRRRFRAYASSLATMCLVLIVPTNLMRLYLLYNYEEFGNSMVLLFFFNVYLQNWSMCCMETHFAVLCFTIYLKFRSVNDELATIRTDVMVSNRYPAALRSVTGHRAEGCRCISCPRIHQFTFDSCTNDHDCCDDEKAAPSRSQRITISAPSSVLQDRPLETVVEMLRVRHSLIRESVDQLNNMFGVQLALSLITLCVMTLFDIYNKAFHVSGSISRSKFIYSWILQYMFRFSVIIITAHHATQEASILYRYKQKLRRD